ncbi:MAG: polysaccharide deacetylase family protein [Chloroflexota bacterium]
MAQRPDRTGMLNGLSIDVEEWFHAELVRRYALPDRGRGAPERRVAWAIEPILHLLRRHGVKATFFVVGDVLRHEPALIQRLWAEGHEIGCHGWSHRPLWGLDPEQFERELADFDREVAAVLPVEEIVGFRAPTFSLDERSAWALDHLAAHGYRYDSSIFPMRVGLYGVEGCPTTPYRIAAADLCRKIAAHDHASGGLIEFPVAVYRAGGFAVPVAGGFYLRAIPVGILAHLLGRINAGGAPFALYLHPWEADAGTPRMRRMSAWQRWATYHNSDKVLAKLEALVQRFRFAPLRQALGISGGRSASAAAPSGEPR